MKRIIIALTALIFLAVAGCTTNPSKKYEPYSRPKDSATSPGRASAAQAKAQPKTDKPVKNPRPYLVMGKWYQPLPSARGYREKGKASWYGKKFHGRKTANGETYNMYGVTAAHKTLPLGTVVHVKNLENSKELNIRINDRGPFVTGRIIDLSYGAAKKLGVVGPGTAYVEVSTIGSAIKKENAPKQYFTVQVGAFSVYDNATRQNAKLSSEYNGVHLKKYFHPDHGNLYGVRIGSVRTLVEGEQLRDRLRENGFKGAFVVSE